MADKEPVNTLCQPSMYGLLSVAAYRKPHLVVAIAFWKLYQAGLAEPSNLRSP